MSNYHFDHFILIVPIREITQNTIHPVPHNPHVGTRRIFKQVASGDGVLVKNVKSLELLELFARRSRQERIL
jgi:hypothetical protein